MSFIYEIKHIVGYICTYIVLVVLWISLYVLLNIEGVVTIGDMENKTLPPRRMF